MADQPPPSPFKTYTLTTSSISYKKTTTHLLSFKLPPNNPAAYILRDVSLAAFPSQILAVVGPSGAGKSTVLDILAARTSPTSGTLLLNSLPINPSSFRKLSAHVPQHDAYLPLLTVAETFVFTATLLIPTTADVKTVVSSLLCELKLTHLANTRLGSGLSGGERRRVSIGLSLLHDPSVLILDEPTSSLDSTSAFNVMQILKTIATSRHRTVVLSIHQPSFKILSLIDRILLLSKGSVVHHGSLPSLESFLNVHGFSVPPQLNPLEFAMEILPSLQTEKSSPLGPPPASVVFHGGERQRIYRSSRVREIYYLYRRFWKIIYRTKQLLLTNTLEALVVGVVLGTIYINIGFDKQGVEKRFGFFAFTLTFLLSSTTETLPIFVNERPILIREASSGVYRLSSYLVANTLVFLPYLLVVAVIYSVSVYFLVGLCKSWEAIGYFVVVMWVILSMANSFVLFLSSLAPNYIAGTSLVTISLAGFFLFSGYFISGDRLPKYWVLMHFMSMYKYGLDALLINEYGCLESKCFLWYDQTGTCMLTGRDVMEKKGLHETQRWINVYVLVGFFLIYRLLCFLVLLRRISRFKK